MGKELCLSRSVQAFRASTRSFLLLLRFYETHVSETMYICDSDGSLSFSSHPVIIVRLLVMLISIV